MQPGWHHGLLRKYDETLQPSGKDYADDLCSPTTPEVVIGDSTSFFDLDF